VSPPVQARQLILLRGDWALGVCEVGIRLARGIRPAGVFRRGGWWAGSEGDYPNLGGIRIGFGDS